MTINKVLHKIQQKLKAPKGQFNSFAKYNYRSCEDIVEAVKKVLPDGVSLTLSDNIELHGAYLYVRAEARLWTEDGSCISTSGCAREALNKKGMDEGQMTGTASSYARKYALNGLFAIDDTKDADTNEYKKESTAKAVIAKKEDTLLAKLLKTVSGISNSERVGDFKSNQGLKDMRDELYLLNEAHSRKVDDALEAKEASFVLPTPSGQEAG